MPLNRGSTVPLNSDIFELHNISISFQGDLHPKKKVAESNAAKLMLESDDFKEYLKHLDRL